MFDERSTPFKILMLTGIWCPLSYTSPLKKTVYYVYTFFVVLLHLSNTLVQFLDMILIAESITDVIDNIFVLLTFLSTCFRLFNTLVLRKQIVISMEMLATEPCKPANEEEDRIQNKYDETIRWNTMAYTAWIEGSVMFLIVDSLLRDVKSKQLLFRAWYPFDYALPLVYWFPYLHQTSGLVVSSLIHTATDSLISGFMLQACCQIEILQHRLEGIVASTDTRTDLRKYATQMNNTFNIIITAQFCAITLILCTSVYVLLEAELFSMEFLSALLYLSCMLIQIYIFCWYGNKITLKSMDVSNTIFHMKWMMLSSQEQKDLLLIMKRAATPIVLRIAYMINVNLNSFVNIIKVSYSTFNVLKQSEQM